MGTKSALESMEQMVKNPYNRTCELLSDDDDDSTSKDSPGNGRVRQPRKRLLVDSPENDSASK